MNGVDIDALIKEDYNPLAEDRELQFRTDIIEQMKSRRGRRIVNSIIRQSGFFQLSFNIEPNIAAFNEGNRNLGLWLYETTMALCPELLFLMLKEQKEDDDVRQQQSGGGNTNNNATSNESSTS